MQENCIGPFLFAYPIYEVRNMSYIAPEIREKFESLSVNLKNTILEKNVRIQNIHDLIKVLEDIVAEDE